MKRPTDEVLLAFLEGSLGGGERADLLDRLDADPNLAEALRLAAAGLENVRSLGDREGALDAGARPPRRPRRISPWWAVAASAATIVLSVPATLRLAAPAPAAGEGADALRGAPASPDPSFVLVLHGRWPDADEIDADEGRRRATEYWAWTSSLAEDGLLVAAGDLRWEPGERLGPMGRRVAVGGDVVDDSDYMVGMFAVRVDTYEEALELARASPHLRYGGSVSVRRVGAGFVTVPGMGDWTD